MPNTDNTSSYILVTNNTPNIVLLIQTHLERHGYEVETASNGVEALAKIHDRRPAVFVTDVMMPEMDGIELLQTIRTTPTSNPSPSF